MKTVMIETVANGWIVRPFSPSVNWASTDTPAIAVYNKLEELQSDLPKLLQFQPAEVTSPQPRPKDNPLCNL